jgi:hypothetical protein
MLSLHVISLILVMTGPATPELVVSKAAVSLAPGRSALVVIKLVQAEPLKSMGFAGHQGRLVAEVKVGRGPWVQTDIGDLVGHSTAPWWFADGEWNIVFADYNHDGHLDFNLGGQCGSNNFCYWLFTIEPTGRVALLPLPSADDHPGFLWLCDDRNSTSLIDLTGDGIAFSGYDPASGGFRIRLRWDQELKSFVRMDETPSEKKASEKNHAP